MGFELAPIKLIITGYVMKNQIFVQTKVLSFCLFKASNLVNIHTLSDKNASDKIDAISAWCQKFCRTKILSVENFVQYFSTKVRQKSDKIVEILAWYRKLCPTKILGSVISPQNFGEKSGFSKGFCLGGEVTLQSAWGEMI